MKRRQFFTALSASTLAGCSTSGDSSDQEANEESDTNKNRSPTEKTTLSPTQKLTSTQSSTDFEIVSISGPEYVEINQKFTINVAVKNIGEAAGEFSAPLYYKDQNNDWTKIAEREFGTVSPREKTTFQYPISGFDKIISASFKVGDSDKVYKIKTVPAEKVWGEPFKAPSGYSITVYEPQLQEKYRVGENDSSYEETSGGDGIYAFVQVSAENTTKQPVDLPVYRHLQILANQTQYEQISWYPEPVNKESFPGGTLQPGLSASGWVLFSIKQGLKTEDLTVNLTYRINSISVNWSSSN